MLFFYLAKSAHVSKIPQTLSDVRDTRHWIRQQCVMTTNIIS